MNLRTISRFPDALYLETECDHFSIQDVVREFRMRKSIVTHFAQETLYTQCSSLQARASRSPISQTVALISSETLRSIHRTGPVLHHGRSVTQANCALLPSFLLSLLHNVAQIESQYLLVPVSGTYNFFFLFIEIIQQQTLHVQVAMLDAHQQRRLYLEDGRTVDWSLYVGLTVQKLPSV